MRHDERYERDPRSFRRDEQRSLPRREASERSDWYERDEEDYRPSSDYRDTSDSRRDFSYSDRDSRRTQGSRELSRERSTDGNRRGSDQYRTSSSFGSGGYYSDRSESRSQFSGRGPKSYKRSDDRIKEDVCEMLTRDNNIDAESIEIEVKDGEVTLSGTVPDRRMKHMAEDCVDGCFGVKEVTNNIRVSRESSSTDRSGSSAGMKKPSSSGATTNLPNH